MMGRTEALNTILKHFLSTKDFGQAREDINNLIELELLQQQEELERWWIINNYYNVEL